MSLNEALLSSCYRQVSTLLTQMRRLTALNIHQETQYALTRHLSLRAEYRGLVYKAPDFNLAGLNTDSWTQIAQPSAGIVFRF